MRAHTTGLRIAAGLIVALAMPTSAAAAAESVVPPENSAASQYTEALPTAGGDKTGGGGGHRSPAKVLGAHDAKKLESRGKAGREVAEVVAATAPSATASAEPTPTVEPRVESDSQGGEGNGGEPAPATRPGSAKPGGGKAKAEPAPRPDHAEPIEAPGGSSGLLAVAGQATGTSSNGELGLLLPLALLGGLIWAIAYLRRQRHGLD